MARAVVFLQIGDSIQALPYQMGDSIQALPHQIGDNYTSSTETNVSLFEENQSNIIFLTLQVTG